LRVTSRGLGDVYKRQAKLAVLLQDLRERDERDSSRSLAPLKPTQDAHLLDTTELSVDQAVDKILLWYQGSR
jgi:cytidylate kinase